MSNGKVFTRIADRYDAVNRLLSLGQDQEWRRRVVERLPDGPLLDVGGGTGAALPLFTGRTVVELDPSREMLERNPAAHRVQGVGEALPFRDGTFAAVFSAFVFRNLDSVALTLAEFARVLRPGGKAGIVDLSRPASPAKRALHRAGTAVVLPLVGAAVGGREEYRYLHRSLDALPPPEDMYASGPLRLEALWRMGPLGFVYGVVLAKD